jgi:hypothetical protein
LIRDIGKILEAVPLINRDELFASIEDSFDISRAFLDTILAQVMPTERVLVSFEQSNANWVGIMSELLSLIEDSDTLKGHLPACLPFKELRFLQDMGAKLVKPFDLALATLSQVREALDQSDLEEQPE